MLPELSKSDEMPKCLEEYFSEKEVISLVQEFEKPKNKGKKKKEVQPDESDSNPSCDNFDIMEINECFEEILDDN